MTSVGKIETGEGVQTKPTTTGVKKKSTGAKKAADSPDKGESSKKGKHLVKK